MGVVAVPELGGVLLYLLHDGSNKRNGVVVGIIDDRYRFLEATFDGVEGRALLAVLYYSFYPLAKTCPLLF